MNKDYSLLKFLAGLALLSVGLFLLLNRVHVGTGWGGFGMMYFGSFRMPSGLVVIPFIIGIIWMFGSGGSFISKIFTGITVLLIIAAIIMTTSFWLDRMTMFDWLLILIMIFGGGTIVVTTLFHDDKTNINDKDGRWLTSEELEHYKKLAEAEKKKSSDLSKELNEIKKNISK